ncbi:amino acid adenylation domain-containing protein [Streptomyces sp. NPDC101393]|uniref:non-ribosomal peptide synthetase family protein n=1 Tax=Streptomyces sp. NPDC101393 TaxID=3366141 RepID=UPI003823F2F8
MENSAAVGQCLTDVLTQQALARPNDLAVVCEEDSLTYRDLLEGSHGTAALLNSLGVRAESRVGLFAEPSLDLMLGVWGILFAGGGYVPLSPEYRGERLRDMIEDAGLSVVFTQEHLRSALRDLVGPDLGIVTKEDVAAFLATHPDSTAHLPRQRPEPDHLAYVVYTSGSTGKTKGVMIEQRSITHQMAWLSRAHKIDKESVVLHKTLIGFDAAQWEILAPATGAQVVLGRPGIHRDPERLIETITRHKVTTLQCVPTLLQALVDSDELHRCTSLTQIFSGGESLSRALARRCTEALPDCTLVNLYGPTECTINASSYVVDRGRLTDGGRPGDSPPSVPIGTPADGVRFTILDAAMRPVGPGEAGELHISGVQLARGYLGRPDLTAERFIPAPRPSDDGHGRLYRTGDIATWNPDGTAQFLGRSDDQVKLHGFRIELNEIRLAIESHDWVRNAAVFVQDEPRTGSHQLVACVELSPREATLMDQGAHGDHHLSKESKLQVRAQLAAPGCRETAEPAGKPAYALPGARETAEQRRKVFARKTYRFYDGGPATRDDVLAALARRPAPPATARRPEELSYAELGGLLRWFGRFTSEERLLPKYGYASPGALYAAQLYLEIEDIGGLPAGFYYYHPVEHRLLLVQARPATGAPCARLHLMGKRRAIEPVYRINIQEVLEFEAGHMLGLFDEVLPAYGLRVRELPYEPATRRHLDVAEEDHYLGSFELAPYDSGVADGDEGPVDVYVQFHPGSDAGVPPGQYLVRDGTLERIGDELVLKRHVVAINQQTYQRADLGITVVSRRPGNDLRGYLDLGRKLQQLQMNDSGLGFMSAGYSSRTGHDLPAAKRMAAVLRACGRPAGPSYFFVGGRVSDAQLAHEGMNEDIVHMKGPAELIRHDLVGLLPAYMVPQHILVLERLPHTANGKLDTRTLRVRAEEAVARSRRPHVPPRTRTETRVAALWQSVMQRDGVSVHDDFFASGGNSLFAVALVNRLNREFGRALPVQVLFEHPTVESLAREVDAPAAGRPAAQTSRLIRMTEPAGGHGSPVYCWPGLGGYPMNLRLLAERTCPDRPFHGVQTYGINAGETPWPSIEAMAAADLEALRRVHPGGPYTLWGYSFGARVAFETARLLERAGEHVERVCLIAPGSPRVDTEPVFLTILCSVFTGATSGPVLEECLRSCADTDDPVQSFLRFAVRRFPEIAPELIGRIVSVVRHTYAFGYAPSGSPLTAPVTILRAAGDEMSVFEHSAGPGPLTTAPPTVLQLEAGHYAALRDPGVDELAKLLHRQGHPAQPRPTQR